MYNYLIALSSQAYKIEAFRRIRIEQILRKYDDTILSNLKPPKKNYDWFFNFNR
jgi:hypothetical protein